jgi:dGTPase
MSANLSWRKLLSTQRMEKPGEIAPPPAPFHTAERNTFEADYDRVVFSEPFRRLAKKTQVHPLAPNDHIHNRLTHSIEVASVGRSIAKKVQYFLQEQHPEQGELFQAIPMIVQVGCLIHDIGNPPFGHAGEYAIREWMEAHQNMICPGDVSEATRQDLLLFEGNAQGFRLAARADNPCSGYMRLTFASLGSMIKYPWTSTDERAARDKKFSVFASEEAIFTRMAESMGLIGTDGNVVRHPLSFLSEAADDICYRMLDMEDAVSMRIFPEQPVKELFLKLAGLEGRTDLPISKARGLAIAALIDESLRIFCQHYTQIMAGEHTRDLKGDFSARYDEGFAEIAEMYTEIFSHRAKLRYELGAYKMVGRIIKAFSLALQSLCKHRDYAATPFITRKCLDLAWDIEYIQAHRHESYEWWLRQAFDFVSGLTDNYAIQISSEIEGILTA